MNGFVVALSGAESTGKTTLSHDIAFALRAEGRSVAVVAEYLREFCEHAGRTPRPDEQRGIAAEQTRRIDAAATTHEIVIADTTALTIAVYSDYVFADRSLYGDAERDHARCDVSLLTAVDIPWQADGLQREGPQVQGPIDALLRASLARASLIGPSLGLSIVAGSGAARVESALKAVRHALQRSSPDDEAAANPRWRWHCDRCGDTDCERHALLGTPARY